MEIEEIWKSIENYPNYKISNYGRVKSLNYRNLGYEGLLIGNDAGCEYQKVYLYNLHNKRKFIKIHQLVANAFIVNPDPINKTQINHIEVDENGLCVKSNNTAWNLEWVTPLENRQHAHKHDLYNKSKWKKKNKFI